MTDNITEFALRGAMRAAEGKDAAPAPETADPTVSAFYRRLQAMQHAIEISKGNLIDPPNLTALARQIDEFFRNG